MNIGNLEYRKDYMELSLFLAKFLGVFLLIMTALWAFRKSQVEAAYRDIFASKGSIALSAFFNLFLGLFIAVQHNVWQQNWRGLITLIGYIAIFRGIQRLGFPAEAQRMASKIARRGSIVIVVLAVVGIYLTYQGFNMNMSMMMK